MEEGIVVHSFQRNPEEEVRFCVREYKERRYIDVRLWFLPANGEEFRPTKKGITLSLEYLAEIKKGLERVGKVASEMALQQAPKPVK